MKIRIRFCGAALVPHYYSMVQKKDIPVGLILVYSENLPISFELVPSQKSDKKMQELYKTRVKILRKQIKNAKLRSKIS